MIAWFDLGMKELQTGDLETKSLSKTCMVTAPHNLCKDLFAVHEYDLKIMI